MIRILHECSRARGWDVIPVPSKSDPDLEHLVTIADHAYLCDCPGFQYRGTCRHKRLAELERCSWTEKISPLEEPGTCPQCGAPTIMIAEEIDDDEE